VLSRPAKERRRVELDCVAGAMGRKGGDLLWGSAQAGVLARRKERQGHGENLVSDQRSVAGTLQSLVFRTSGPGSWSCPDRPKSQTLSG
jgi:hypothetical protein